MNTVCYVSNTWNTVVNSRSKAKMSNQTEQKTGYKYRIGFHQSLTTGVIGFEGNVNFDSDDEHFAPYHDELLNMCHDTENAFRRKGYRVASDIEPKVQPVKNGQSNKEVKD